MRSRLRIGGICIVMALGLFMAGRVTIAAPQDDTNARRQEMMAHRGDMMARMTALDARIATLTEQMNASAGEAKISAMAALLNAFVEQHKAMRSAMMGAAGSTGEPPAPREMCPANQPAPSTAPSHVHPAN